MPTDKLSYAQRLIIWLWLKVRPFVAEPVADRKRLEGSAEQLAAFRELMESIASAGVTAEEVDAGLRAFQRDVEEAEKKVYGGTE